jgi:DNA-binding response OmpR family regulator
VLVKRLERVGWPHRVLASAVPAEAVIPMRLDAVVVDIAVLGPHVWSYLDELCGAIPHLGVLVCTGVSSMRQRVRGLRLGVDDWVTKPCHPEELLARVEAVVRRRRRATGEPASGPVATGDIELLAGQFQATAGGRSLDLTRREFELLELLMRAEGRVLPREEIYERVWGYAMVRGDRSVDVYVRKLRHKLETASPGWWYIHTHIGIGYRFEAEPVDAGAAPADELAEPLTTGLA